MNDVKNIKAIVLERIKSGEFEMRSKTYFALRVALFALFALIALAISILIFNFIFFSIRLSGQGELLGFGPRGVLFFAQMFPWHLVLLDIIFIALAERMLRHFRFGYKNPVVVLVGALLLIAIALGLALDRGTPLNARILLRAHEERFGPLDRMYMHARLPAPPESGICRCVIVQVNDDGVIAYNMAASTSPVKLLLPPGFATSTLHKGDVFFIAGDRDGNVIRIFGLHEGVPIPPEQSELR